MTKHKFRIPKPGGRPGETEELTTLVMSEEEFEDLLRKIAEGDPVLNVATRERMRSEDVDAFRQAKQVPLVARGTKTEHLFRAYKIGTPYFSAVVRGHAERMGLR